MQFMSMFVDARKVAHPVLMVEQFGPVHALSDLVVILVVLFGPRDFWEKYFPKVTACFPDYDDEDEDQSVSSLLDQ